MSIIILKILFVIVWLVGGTMTVNWMPAMAIVSANAAPKSSMNKRDKRETLIITTLAFSWLFMWYIGVPVLTFIL